MALVSRLGVVLGLDSAEFSAGLGKAEAGLKSFVSNSLTTKLSLAALGTALTVAAKEAVDYADKIADVAKANEVSVATVLKLTDSLILNGGQAENTSKMFSSFTNKIDEAAKGSKTAQESFAKLGISLDDLAKLSQQELLDKAMKTLASPQMGDVITRNAGAMELFGKAAKGVDIRGLAQDYLQNEHAFIKEEQAFMAINKAMDSMDIAMQKTKQRMATDLAPIITGSVNFFDTLINGWTRLEEHIEKAAKAQEKLVAKQQGVSVWKPAGLVGTPITADEASKIPGFKGARDVEAAKDPAAEKAKNLADALKQQHLQLRLNTEQIGEQKTKYEEMQLLFDKTGRFYDLRNSQTAKDLLAQAKLYDLESKKYETAKNASQWAIQKAQEEKRAYEQKMKEVANQALQIKQQREAFDLTVKDVEFAKERLDYEAQLVNLSDTQREKALQYFDLRQKMMQMSEKEKNILPEQIEAYQKMEQSRIDSEEATKRAQNTFQSGWNRAWENFVEKSKDSASLGAEAFNSMASSMESALDNFVRTGKLSFKELASSIIQDLIRIQLKAQMTSIFGGGGLGSIFGGIFGNNGGVGANAGAYGIESNPYLNFATGGNVYDNQAYIVGERGAEVFVPNSNGTIIPNNTLAATMGNQPQVVYNGTVIQNMNAIDTQSATQFLAKNKQAVWAANQSAQRALPMSR